MGDRWGAYVQEETMCIGAVEEEGIPSKGKGKTLIRDKILKIPTPTLS